MAVIVYRCDICTRTIEKQQNKYGLEVIDRCVITRRCKGKMHQIKVLQDFNRERLPENITQEDRYIPRNILHNHHQRIITSTWTIKHNLGTYPILNVYVNKPTSQNPDNVSKISPTSTSIINDDTLSLTFDRPYKGTAQLIGRSSDPRTPTEIQTPSTKPNVQISVKKQLMLGCRTNFPNEEPKQLIIEIKYTNAQQINSTIIYGAQYIHKQTGPWTAYKQITYNNKQYQIRSIDLSNNPTDNEAIISGSVVKFTGVDPTGKNNIRKIKQNELILLFASDPYDSADIIQDQIIDPFSISDTNTTSLFLNNGDIFASPSVIQSIYPPIILN